ncbi:hypothetical protein BJ508DRAFT_323827 [Ascobolus immersus RN42]|uniref:Uncharacterized protein n=1 Tax=Ascobolus immersus RN42 TaxID=1160509 RepID=A0A3N4IDH6_ASCIM|nr:hypothetical protein BJ508DRAFT_323827 [Ascobolus immersus RN42]
MVQWDNGRDKLVLLTMMFGTAAEKQSAALAAMVGCTEKALSLRRCHYKKEYNALKIRLAEGGFDSSSSSTRSTASSRSKVTANSSPAKRKAGASSGKDFEDGRQARYDGRFEGRGIYEDDDEPDFPQSRKRQATQHPARRQVIVKEDPDYEGFVDGFVKNEDFEQPLRQQTLKKEWEEDNSGFTPPGSPVSSYFGRSGY